jgi:hypothetical protein
MIPSIFFRLLASSASVNCSGLGGSCDTGLPKVTANSSVVHTALMIFFGIAAVISVLMIVIGGLMFVTSGGKPEEAAKARETIIYAAVGLLVSLSAEAVVAFVVRKL